jgi:cytochrome P450
VRRLSRSPRDPTFVADPYPFYAEARAAGPLFLWEEYDHPCAAGWDAVNALLRDRRFGREPLGGFGPRPARMADFYAIDDRSMLEREPPDHTRLRGLVLRAITSRRIAALGPGIAALASSLADALPEPEADLLPAFARPLPVVVIARLLGVPEDRSDDLLAWSNAMVAVYQARRDSAVEARANEAARDFTAFLRAAIAARRRAPRDDLLTALVAAEAEAERLDDAELVATATLLLNAGHEATVNALANGVALILGRGLDPAALFADAAASAATVEELLRFDPPLHLFTRYAREDAEAFGHRFRRGEVVGLLLAAANRDPARFPDPDRFDAARFRGERGEGHAAFGAGIHFCLGAPLARLELALGLGALFRRRLGTRPRRAAAIRRPLPLPLARAVGGATLSRGGAAQGALSRSRQPRGDRAVALRRICGRLQARRAVDPTPLEA